MYKGASRQKSSSSNPKTKQKNNHPTKTKTKNLQSWKLNYIEKTALIYLDTQNITTQFCLHPYFQERPTKYFERTSIERKFITCRNTKPTNQPNKSRKYWVCISLRSLFPTQRCIFLSLTILSYFIKKTDCHLKEIIIGTWALRCFWQLERWSLITRHKSNSLYLYTSLSPLALLLVFVKALSSQEERSLLECICHALGNHKRI